MLGVKSGIITRRAYETNELYRLPDRHELVEGLELVMVDVTHMKPWSDVWGTTIRLDPNPVRVLHDVQYVFYHCVRPAWTGNCYVPLLAFTGEYIWPPEDTFVQNRYWIPMR